MTCAELLNTTRGAQGSSYAAVSEDGAAALGARNAEGTRTARSRLARAAPSSLCSR